MNNSMIILFLMCILFNTDFWRQLLISLLTVSFGIPTGLILNRVIKKQEFTKKRQKTINSLIDSLNDNKDRLYFISDEISSNDTWLPSIELETEAIFNAYLQRYDLFHLQSVRNKVSILKNDLIILNTELKQMIEFHSEAQKKPHYVFRFKETRDLIKSKIPEITKYMESTIKLIKELE